MSRATLPVLVALGLAAALAAPSAHAAAPVSYCAAKVTQLGAERLGLAGGVAVLATGDRTRRLWLCSNAKRRLREVSFLDAGYDVARVRGVPRKCLAILGTAKGKIPEVVGINLATAFQRRSVEAGVTPIGYNTAGATVRSMVLSRSCVLATGAEIEGAGDSVSRRIDIFGIGTASYTAHVIVPTAPATTNADLRTLRAVGTTVSWQAASESVTYGYVSPR